MKRVAATSTATVRARGMSIDTGSRFSSPAWTGDAGGASAVVDREGCVEVGADQRGDPTGDAIRSGIRADHDARRLVRIRARVRAEGCCAQGSQGRSQPDRPQGRARVRQGAGSTRRASSSTASHRAKWTIGRARPGGRVATELEHVGRRETIRTSSVRRIPESALRFGPPIDRPGCHPTGSGPAGEDALMPERRRAADAAGAYIKPWRIE